MPNLASKHSCSGCMGCKDICPKNAITSTVEKDGHSYINIDPDKCVGCNLCEKICPVVNNYSYGERSLMSSFFAGWSENISIRAKGATSGIFGTIANSFIEKGGWVVGAVMDGLTCKYIITNSIKDIDRLQGSKYTYSDPSGIYRSVLKKIKEGNKVLFSGLPCHVAALLNFVPIKLQNFLYTIDIICGGVSSPILLKRFASEKGNVASILSFRNKSNGWKANGYRYSLTYITDDGQIISESQSTRNIVTDGFACELTDRYSCYDCQHNGIHRKSDMTIGDLWKDKQFPKEHHKGVSSIIVHSEKGKELLSSAPICHTEIDPRNILIPNHRIFNGKSIKSYFPERRLVGVLFKYLNYKSLMRIYASDLRTANVLWWPIAVYRILSFKIDNIIQKRICKKILSRIFR